MYFIGCPSGTETSEDFTAREGTDDKPVDLKKGAEIDHTSLAARRRVSRTTSDGAARTKKIPTWNEDIEQNYNKVIDFPTQIPYPGRPGHSMAALQEWEGVVTAVRDDIVYASLIDITAKCKQVEEIAEIPLIEISLSDRSKVVPGAIFRWVIGYRREASGMQLNCSVIYFRRAFGPPKAEPPPFVFEKHDNSSGSSNP